MASDIDAAIAESEPEKPKKKDPVASIAGQIPHLPAGQRAALRRMYLTRNRPGEAIGVVMGLLHRAGVPQLEWIDPATFERWSLLAHVAAVLSGTAAQAPHAPGRKLGRALWDAGYSEKRQMRLTSARGAALDDQVRLAAQFLARAGEGPVNLWTIRQLIGDDPVQAERARFEIARDYYDAEHNGRGDAQ
jgi:hypothetical protein